MVHLHVHSPVRSQARFFLTPELDSLVHYPKMMEELAEMIGCKPNLAKIFFTDNALWRRPWLLLLLTRAQRLHSGCTVTMHSDCTVTIQYLYTDCTVTAPWLYSYCTVFIQ